MTDFPSHPTSAIGDDGVGDRVGGENRQGRDLAIGPPPVHAFGRARQLFERIWDQYPRLRPRVVLRCRGQRTVSGSTHVSPRGTGLSLAKTEPVVVMETVWKRASGKAGEQPLSPSGVSA